VREFFDADWRALPGERGLVEPDTSSMGVAAGAMGVVRGHPQLGRPARRLFENGCAASIGASGVNTVGGSQCPQATRRLWPQTGIWKAAVGSATSRKVSWPPALAQYLDVPARGAWRDKLRADGTFRRRGGAGDLFYHLMVAVLELTGRAA